MQKKKTSENKHLCIYTHIIIVIIDYRFAGHEGLFESLVRYAV